MAIIRFESRFIFLLEKLALIDTVEEWMALISEAPFAPNRCSGLRLRSLVKISLADGGTISGPEKWRDSERILQFILLVFLL